MRLIKATAHACLLGLSAALPTQTAALPSAIPQAPSTATPAPSTAHLEIRQGVPVTAVPVAATVAGQVPPITTYEIGMVKGGAYVQVQVVYTQTFVTPIDQYPAPTIGSIGLGTIAGEIGVVKTKRDVMPTQLPTPPEEVLTLEKLKQILDERPVKDESERHKMSLVLTPEEFKKILAAAPIEDAVGDEKRDVFISKEMLNELVN